MRGRRRIAIVDDADEMSEEASNAFLKSLEEPPSGSVLILLATTAEGMLETVVSRCRVMRFEPLREEDLAAILLDIGSAADKAEAARLSRLGEGSVRRALGFADGEVARFRRGLIDELGSGWLRDPGGLAQELEAFVREAGKESTLHRERARLLLGELAGFFRAVLWQTAGLEPPTADESDRKAARALGSKLEPEDVIALAERCLEADYQIGRKAYLPLVLESLAHDLGRVLQKKR
jgi:DNA polymerase-3 subunit delta'